MTSPSERRVLLIDLISDVLARNWQDPFRPAGIALPVFVEGVVMAISAGNPAFDRNGRHGLMGILAKKWDPVDNLTAGIIRLKVTYDAVTLDYGVNELPSYDALLWALILYYKPEASTAIKLAFKTDPPARSWRSTKSALRKTLDGGEYTEVMEVVKKVVLYYAGVKP